MTLRALFGPGYAGENAAREVFFGPNGVTVPVCISGSADNGQVIIISPGFASRLLDYGPLTRLFEDEALVIRISHKGNSRLAGLQALLRLVWHRFSGAFPQGTLENRPGGCSWKSAALKVRAWIHRSRNRQRRLSQLRAVFSAVQSRYPNHSLSLLGHSYGTDTVLRLALEQEVENLFLCSPHPPGYLIPVSGYSRLQTHSVHLITGTQDFTRDGTGPEERLEVAGVVPPEQLGSVTNLEGVKHMDFAFCGLGKPGWEQELALSLREQSEAGSRLL